MKEQLIDENYIKLNKDYIHMKELNISYEDIDRVEYEKQTTTDRGVSYVHHWLSVYSNGHKYTKLTKRESRVHALVEQIEKRMEKANKCSCLECGKREKCKRTDKVKATKGV